MLTETAAPTVTAPGAPQVGDPDPPDKRTWPDDPLLPLAYNFPVNATSPVMSKL